MKTIEDILATPISRIVEELVYNNSECRCAFCGVCYSDPNAVSCSCEGARVARAHNVLYRAYCDSLCVEQSSLLAQSSEIKVSFEDMLSVYIDGMFLKNPTEAEKNVKAFLDDVGVYGVVTKDRLTLYANQKGFLSDLQRVADEFCDFMDKVPSATEEVAHKLARNLIVYAKMPQVLTV